MKYSKELKIGAFVLIISIVSFFLINYLRGEDIFNKEIELVSEYENIDGLVVSSPVFIKGYKAGKVSEVEYMPETGTFHVLCSVRKEFVIPEDSKMMICAMDIMGTKAVRIELGTSETFVKDGGFLQPAIESGLIDGLAGEIAPLLSKVSSTLDSLGVTVSGVNRVLNEKNTHSISRTISHLESTMADVKKIAATVEGRSAELDAFICNLAELSANFNVIAEKVDTTVSGVNGVMDTLNASDLEGTIASMKALLENINDPDGSIGKLLKDDSVYNSVDSLLKDVDVLVNKIQENPKKYIKISVF